MRGSRSSIRSRRAPLQVLETDNPLGDEILRGARVAEKSGRTGRQVRGEHADRSAPVELVQQGAQGSASRSERGGRVITRLWKSSGMDDQLRQRVLIDDELFRCSAGRETPAAPGPDVGLAHLPGGKLDTKPVAVVERDLALERDEQLSIGRNGAFRAGRERDPVAEIRL